MSPLPARGKEAEGVGVEPTGPCGPQFSGLARRTVSGCLPCQWRRRESNPSQSVCKTDSPALGTCVPVSEVRPGIGPGLQRYHRRVRPKHFQTFSDPGWTRTIVSWMSPGRRRLWTTGSRSSVQPAGVEPTSTCISGRGLADRPRLVSSAPYGNRTRLAWLTLRSPRQLRHRASSKDGRSRTLCVWVGATLLTQEHVPDGQRKGQESNLQGLSPRPLSRRVPSPVGSPFRIELSRQDSNLHPSG